MLLPLADALGPMPRPVTESAPTTDAPATPPPTVLPEKATSAHGGGVTPDFAAVTATDKLATLSRPWAETATELHLESDKGERGGDGTGGQVTGLGAGQGTGHDVPPPAPTTSESSPPAPPVALAPAARIVVRPADSGATGGSDGSRRPEDEPAVVTLDGLTVPLSQLRRLVPDAPVQPAPGRAVRMLTISQSPAEDGTSRDAGRRGLLGQDTFRGVRTVSAPASPSARLREDSAVGAESAPASPVRSSPVRRPRSRARAPSRAPTTSWGTALPAPSRSAPTTRRGPA